MRHFLNCCSKLLWCGCIIVWWCSEFNNQYHSDYLCPMSAKVFVWWIRLHIHRSKLNITVSMVIERSQYRPLTKEIFSSPGICGNILNIFWGGINTTNISVKINWDTWSHIFFLETAVCGRLWLVLGPWFHRQQGSLNVE